ncbi:hypothetical protein D8S78_18195 [Natrialba swarupiae]|nr:hypothetical protein [Natrialba swarupiae]
MGSSLVRALCLLVTVVGAGVACLGFVVRRAWSQTTARSDATVAILAGTGVGTVTPFLAALAVGETVVTATELTALYGVTALVLGVTLIVAPWYGEVVRADGPVGPTALLAGSLVLGAVVVAATAEATAFLVGVAALLALTAACFVYDVGRYGRTIALEIGSIGVDRRPNSSESPGAARSASSLFPSAWPDSGSRRCSRRRCRFPRRSASSPDSPQSGSARGCCGDENGSGGWIRQ